MQIKNRIIKNYVLSSKIYILDEKLNKPTSETLIYHLHVKQSKDSFYLFLSRK